MKLKTMLVGMLWSVYYILGSDEPINLLSLVHDKSFAFFDLGISPDEQELLRNLKIEISGKSAMNNYGKLELLELQIFDYLQSLGNDEQVACAASKIIYRIACRDIAACGKDTGWVTLRAFNPTDRYDLPRWHTDGSFYDGRGNTCYKLAYVFKGASTLFLDVSEDIRAHFLNIPSGLTGEQVKMLTRQEQDNLIFPGRISGAAFFANYVASRASAGQGVIFVTGSKGRKKAAIHSEPAIHEDRLFVSVVPGSAHQIEQWRIRIEKE